MGILSTLIKLLFGSPKRTTRLKPTHSPAGLNLTASGRAPYAEISMGNGRYRALSADEVAEMFLIHKAALKEHRAAGARAKRFAAQYEEKLKIAQGTRDQIKTWLDASEESTAAATEIFEQIFFEKEESENKHYKLIEDLNEAADELSDALISIDATAEAILMDAAEPPLPRKRPQKPKLSKRKQQ